MFFFRISDLEATEFFILENYVCFQSLKYSIKFTYKCTYRVQNRSCFFEKKSTFTALLLNILLFWRFIYAEGIQETYREFYNTNKSINEC